MESEEVSRTNVARLNFLYRKISMPNIALSCWMQVPYFVDEMSALVFRKEDIDDQVVYTVASSIYKRILPIKKTEVGKGYNYCQLRRGIRKLGESLQAKGVHGCDVQWLMKNDSQRRKIMVMTANEIAEVLRSSEVWDTDACAKLCSLAGLAAEWEAADGETFEGIVFRAADKLGVEII